ncbi:hypothetical protein C1H46_042587 [Malus baccata]|uniref:Uncharacterized protein n=1 Tax=Malus baccata TaxID=106549 RepID=A0A540KCE4_MALBA|nr:hypothetical protein C1H46_042587 [Malus baccata]
MNQHTTVVQVDVGDVVHSSDGGPAPKKSKLIARRNNPKQALYCDPHEATKVQDNSQLTITRGVRGATFTTIPRVEMSQGRVGSSNPMTGVSPHPPTIIEGAKGATFTTIPRVEMPQSRFGSSSPMTGVSPHPPTITEGAKGATFTTIPRVEMPQGRVGSSNPMTGVSPHPPTITEGAKGAKSLRMNGHSSLPFNVHEK